MNIHTGDVDFEDITYNFLMGPEGRTELARADFALIFGNPHIIDELAQTTAEHYHAGYFDLIVASGCGNWSYEFQQSVTVQTPEEAAESRKTEAVRIFEALQRYDVPESAILLDNSATNTQQNAENAQQVLKSAGYEPSTCIAYGHAQAGTRFLETMARRWPDVFTMGVNVNPYKTDIEKWHECDVFSEGVLMQVAKREKYLQQGDLIAVDLDVINTVATQLPQPVRQSILQDDCTLIV